MFKITPIENQDQGFEVNPSVLFIFHIQIYIHIYSCFYIILKPNGIMLYILLYNFFFAKQNIYCFNSCTIFYRIDITNISQSLLDIQAVSIFVFFLFIDIILHSTSMCICLYILMLLFQQKVKVKCEVAQSCLTLCDPMACNLPGSSVHGIFQARVEESTKSRVLSQHTSAFKISIGNLTLLS